MSGKKPHLYLIDGSGYIFRAFFALPPMTRSDGTPVGAVFGFSRMLYRLLQDDTADYIGLVFDTSRISFRQDIYADYKANRPEPPEDLIPQFPLFRKAGEALGLTPIELDGYEADDLIATYAVLARKQGMQVTILSSDKDLMQMVGDGIEMLDPIKNKRIREPEVLDKFGVAPDRVIDVQALAGDSSDNVPGVPGIGIKTAAQLIQEYGDLQTLLDSAGEIKQPKRRESLIENRKLAEISYELVTLKQDAPLPYPLEELKRRPADYQKAMDFFTEMEFKSLLGGMPTGAADKPKKQTSLSTAAKKYETISDKKDLQKWEDTIRTSGNFAFDTETTSLDPLQAELVGISLAVADGKACYIPLQHRKAGKNGDDLFDDSTPAKLLDNQLPLQEVLDWLKPLLADPALLKIGQNIKYDMAVLANYGLEVISYDDTMLMSFASSAGRNGHGMDELSLKHFDHKPIEYESLTGKGKKQISFAQLTIKDAAPYAAEDADITYRLWQTLKPLLHAEGLWAFYQRTERPLPPIIADMERHGIKVSAERLEELTKEFTKRLEKLEAEIHKQAGRKFNVGSPKQLGEVLFDEMKIADGKKTKSGTWSTDADVLEELAESHEIASNIVEYRMLAKLISTYTIALKAQINEKSKRVHTHFMLTGAQTGRFSSTDPNLQNIPIRTPEGREIRKAFIAEKGCKLLSFDYSQIELRIVAEVAKIPTLQQAFNEDKDIHAMTASEVFGKPLDKVSAEMRRQAKAINFGIIYGISGFGLARQLGCSRTEAKKFIDRYFERFPTLKDYMEAAKLACKENGFVETLFGRRIHINGMQDKNPNRRNYAERQAINAPIQGSAADIIKRAMIRIPQALEDAKLTEVKMLLQVHDELIFEVPEKLIPKAKPIILDIMQGANLPKCPLGLPLKVDCGEGDTWFEAH